MRKKKISNLLELAIQIALEAHAGQKDKAGEPYIMHPLRVMMVMETDEERMVAVLHDAVEDSALTLDNLRKAGFSPKVIESVDSLTRRNDDTYEQFIEKIKEPLARKVKIADLCDNLNVGRIPNPTEKDFERLEKYKKALSLLRLRTSIS